jgi:excisionase family DNA binding protein
MQAARSSLCLVIFLLALGRLAAHAKTIAQVPLASQMLAHNYLRMIFRSVIVFLMALQEPIGSAEACEILGVDRSTLMRWAAEPKLKSVKMPGQTGARVFDRADVLALKAELDAEAGQKAEASA